MKKKWLALTTLAVILSISLLYAMDASKGLLLVLGGIAAVAIMAWPLLGVIGIIFAGTCFQIIGSSQIVGLPMSLGKLFGFLTLAGWGIHFVLKRGKLT